ncbi:MAG: hypothetical protein WCD18_24620 [Thermosynechococcaceae cyanobacterium]
MLQGTSNSYSGNIAIAVIPQVDGSFICELTSSLEEQAGETKQFHGQTRKHAIAIALENIAHKFRVAAEAEQNIDWEEVERSPSGDVIEKRYHVILHYERVANEESKFDAMVNTQMGNTVVERADITIIQIDPDLPI